MRAFSGVPFRDGGLFDLIWVICSLWKRSTFFDLCTRYSLKQSFQCILSSIDALFQSTNETLPNQFIGFSSCAFWQLSLSSNHSWQNDLNRVQSALVLQTIWTYSLIRSLDLLSTSLYYFYHSSLITFNSHLIIICFPN